MLCEIVGSYRYAGFFKAVFAGCLLVGSIFIRATGNYRPSQVITLAYQSLSNGFPGHPSLILPDASFIAAIFIVPGIN